MNQSAVVANKTVRLSKRNFGAIKPPFRLLAYVSKLYAYIFAMMSNALTKTEQFFKVGPYILWFGMHSVIMVVLGFQRSILDSVYYLVTYCSLGTAVIWLFGFELFPMYLAREGKSSVQLVWLTSLNIFVLVIGIMSHGIMAKLLGLTEIREQYAPQSVRVVLWVLMVALGAIYMASIRVTQVYHQEAVKKIAHKADRIEAELKLLKNQISPHFLFNTLNNIYGLAYLGDERAAEMIAKLSNILRYLLYDCDQHYVMLSKEKDLVDHYLGIQLLKHEHSPNVDFYHAGITNNHKISPMILINFVENCFKHADLEDNPEGWIKISLEVENNTLHFRTQNTVRDSAEEAPIDRKGIGLTNSLKLLEANYPGKHQVDITKTGQIYQLALTMAL